MPAHSKGLTRRTSLRYDDREAAILAKVVQVHADAGITISLNDAVRICIRRAAAPLPSDVPSARRAVVTHIRDCAYCTDTDIRCPDGWALNDAYGRVTAAQPPAPASAPQQAPTGPQRPAERRTVGGRPVLLPPFPGSKAG